MCAPGAGPTYNLGSEKETMTLWDHHIATAAWLELIAPSWVAVIDLADSSSLMTAELSQHLYNFIPGTSGCSSNSFSSSCGIKESKWSQQTALCVHTSFLADAFKSHGKTQQNPCSSPTHLPRWSFGDTSPTSPEMWFMCSDTNWVSLGQKHGVRIAQTNAGWALPCWTTCKSHAGFLAGCSCCWEQWKIQPNSRLPVQIPQTGVGVPFALQVRVFLSSGTRNSRADYIWSLGFWKSRNGSAESFQKGRAAQFWIMNILCANYLFRGDLQSRLTFWLEIRVQISFLSPSVLQTSLQSPWGGLLLSAVEAKGGKDESFVRND